MIEREEQRNLIEMINKNYGTRLKRESGSMNKAFDELNECIPNVTAQIVLDYFRDQINNHDAEAKDFAWLVTKTWDIKRFMESYDIPAMEPAREEPATTPTRDMTFGLLEKALAKVMMEEYAPELANKMKENFSEWVAKTYGPIEQKVTFVVPEHGKVEGTTHEMFETVLTYVLADEPVLLTGPAGTGKNVICQQVAEAMNLPFYFSNAVTQEYKLTGFTDAYGNYQPSQFYKAFTEGGILMLDEMDASIPEVLVILNAAIANRYFDFPAPIGKVEAHPDFRVVAGANTFGTGADYTYSGRYQLDGASLDRFAVVEIGYSPKIERSITKDEELLDFFRCFRDACEQSGIRHIVSYRSLKRLEKLKNSLDKTLLLVTSLLKNLEQDDLNMIYSYMKDEIHDNEWMDAFAMARR